MFGETWEPSPTVRAYQSVRMVVPVIVAGAESFGGKLLGGITNPHPDDPARLAQNDVWYRQAQAGDPVALNHLGVKGGVLPAGTGGDPGPWATAQSVNDAKTKYLTLTGQAVPVTKGVEAGSLSSGLSDFIGKIFAQPSKDIGTAAGTAAANKTNATLLTVGLLLAAAIVVGLNIRQHRRGG